MSPKAVVRKLSEVFPTVSEGIILSLLDLSYNATSGSTEVVQFIFNFLQLYRHLLSQNSSHSIIDVANYAHNLTKLYLQTPEKGQIFQTLFDKCYFIDSATYKTITIDQSILKAPSSQIAAPAQTGGTSESNQLKEELNKVRQEV